MNNYNLDFGPELNEKLRSVYKTKQNLIVKLADKCKSKGFNCLKHYNDVIRLAVCIEYLKFTKEQYASLNISDNIFFDTIKDIQIWCSNNNNKGLKNSDWIKNHLMCELFKIGRLQYQLVSCKNATLNYSKLPFKYGDNIVYVHIPQGEKLEYNSCLESLEMANDFFKTHFPNFEYKYYFTETWLLYSKNIDFMSKSSNIIKFQSLFNHCYDFGYDGQTIERVFGKRKLIKKNYADNTSLQKSLKEYLINGGKVGLGIATIDKSLIK